MTDKGIEWYRSLNHDTEFLTEEAKIGFAVCVERRLRQNGASKADLARKLGKSQAYVTKVLRGDANLTIKTMVELAHAVNSVLHLHVAPCESEVRWFEIVRGSRFMEDPVDDRQKQAAFLWARSASESDHYERNSGTA